MRDRLGMETTLRSGRATRPSVYPNVARSRIVRRCLQISSTDSALLS